MFDDSVRGRSGLLLASLALALFGLVGCNFSDPVSDLPRSGCQDDGDCEDHGQCNIDNGVGECACDPGYAGNTCDDCESGYTQAANGSCSMETTTNNSTTNNTTNNTTPTCAATEVLLDGACVANGCVSDPCGDGTCTPIGDNTWECECPNGTMATECPGCDEGCVNGTCDTDNVCVCEPGWSGNSCNTCAEGFQGAACDTCIANAFGPNCDTCDSIGAAEPWWDTEYQVRQGVIVYNPPSAPRSILDGIVVQYPLAPELVGLDANGADVRVVSSPDSELNRILGFDSMWTQAAPTIWFPTVTAVPPNTYDVFYVYSRNPLPALALEDPAMVLRQDRGWYYNSSGSPVFSAAPLSSGNYSIQLRQKNPMAMEVFFHDGGNNGNANVSLRLTDMASGQILGMEVNRGATQGSEAMPFDETVVLANLTDAMFLDVTISPGGDIRMETATIYLGANRVQTGTATLTYRVGLTRMPNPMSAPPNTLTCPVESAP